IFFSYYFNTGNDFLFRFAIFHRDRPQHHSWVNGLELNRIVAGKVQELKSNRAQSGGCPTLMRSLAAWSLWVGIFGIFFAIAMISTFIPSILSCQEVFMVDYLGVYAILPFTLVVCLNNVYFLMLSLAPFGLCVSGVLRSLCLVGRAYTQHITAYMGRASNWAATSWDPLISSKMRNLQPIDFSQDECGLYELRLIDPNRK
ncbi:unnamed protein product, partial [Angiostrongylus costaricensis]|uniref:G_PROTEIN_RECEP_F1_2 domain-containing protein n=1 Tax=Angiostrongylus costaricensis TaxID=334426 RepID=A0A158PGX7_ANGCS